MTTVLADRGRAWSGGPLIAADTRDMGRDEWLALRRSGLGGSDVSAIAGLNPWRGPMHVWLDKTGQMPDEGEPSEAMEWGNLLEEPVARRFADKTQLDVRQYKRLLAHPAHHWMLANCDRFVYPNAGRRPVAPLEVKTTSAWTDGWEDEETIPDAPELQFRHYLEVTGLDHGYMAVLIGGQKFRWFRIERNLELGEQIIDIERRFWEDNVVAGRPPAADGSSATKDLLGALYDVEPDSVVEIGVTGETLIADYWIAQRDAKAADERKELAGNRLRQLLGEHEVGLIDGKKAVTWKEQSRAEHVVHASTSRVLRPSKKFAPTGATTTKDN
jgi:putative phage-type endonuclease